jgi:hypothetical protein
MAAAMATAAIATAAAAMATAAIATATATMATAAAAAAAAIPSRHSSAYIDDQRQRDDPNNFCKFRHLRTSNVTPRKLIFIRSP